jgi:hypothetical protein
MTKDEALKLALEKFEFMNHVDSIFEGEFDFQINAIKEALAQPEQEPLAWEGGEGWESLAWELCADENGEDSCNELIWEGGPIPEPWGDRWMKYEEEAKRLIALVQKHTTPPQRKPLTDEEISDLWCKVSNTDFVTADTHVFARAIEAAHGIKGEA